ncbi:MAG: hypothetical protein AAFY88_13825, partial [Acidobacteriota bacterium]
RVLVLERQGPTNTELYSTFVSTGPPLKISSDDLRGTRIKKFVIAPSSEFLAYTADDRLTGREELFVSSTFGTGALRVSPIDFAGGTGVSPDFFYTADGSRLVYRADVLESGVLEAFSVASDGGPSARLNLALPDGADIISVSPSASPDEALYVGGQNLATSNELFAVDLLGSTPEPLGVPPMARIGEVERFEITADGAHAVYLADQRFFDRPELWSVPTAGGPAVRLSPDLLEGQHIHEFRLDAASQRVAMRIGTRLWSASITTGNPIALSPGDDFGSQFEITPDGQFVIGSAESSNRQSLLRMSTDGGPAIDLLPMDIEYSPEPDRFVITPDSQSVFFLAPDASTGGEASRLYSVPVGGGDATLFSDPALEQIRSFAVSANGSYVIFTAIPAGDDDTTLFGTPTDIPTIVEYTLPFPVNPLASVFPILINDDATYAAYFIGDEVLSIDIETGITRNLTESIVGTVRDIQFVGGGNALLMARGPFETRALDVLSADGSAVYPLTNLLPDPDITAYRSVGDSVVMIVDPDVGDPLSEPIVYQASFPGPQRTPLSAPGQEVLDSIEATEDLVLYRAEDGLFAVPSGGGPRLLVRPPAAAFTDGEFGEQFFYTASEPGNPLVELYAVDVAGAFLFHDGFESGDTSRWSAAVP